MKDKYAKIRPVEPACPPRDGPPRPPGRNGRTEAHESNGKAKSKGKTEKTEERFQTLNRFSDTGADEVGPIAQCVWFHLYRHADKSGLVKISLTQIAKKIRACRRTAQKYIAELREAGLVEVENRGTSKGHTPSTYRIFSLPKRATKRTRN